MIELVSKFGIQRKETFFESYDGDETDYYYMILQQTDFRVLQHIRERELSIETSLSQDEYIQLEKIRQECVEIIRKNEK